MFDINDIKEEQGVLVKGMTVWEVCMIRAREREREKVDKLTKTQHCYIAVSDKRLYRFFCFILTVGNVYTQFRHKMRTPNVPKSGTVAVVR